VTLLIIGTAIFFVLRVLPGDVALQIIGDSAATEEDIEAIREQLGTNRPVLVQYWDWVSRIVRLDPGESLFEQTSITHEFRRRFPLTMELAVVSSIVSAFIALPVGIIAAVRRHRPDGYAARILGIIGMAFPVFWT